LSTAERNYSQLDREGVAVMFGLKKFHMYLWGNHFKIVTDNKALMLLFKEDKEIPPISSARVQRWAIALQAYSYKMEHRPGPLIANADAMSRLPVKTPSALDDNLVQGLSTVPEEHILLTETCVNLNFEEIRKCTKTDKVLAKVWIYTINGWPTENRLEDELVPFQQVELSTMDGVLLRGNRVVIPQMLRENTLSLLHDSHPGIVKMKSIARSYVWWPGIDKDIEVKVGNCRKCLESKPAAHTPIHPWESAGRPWQRVHLDHGFFEGSKF
jgi:hypothetical protein